MLLAMTYNHMHRSNSFPCSGPVNCWNRSESHCSMGILNRCSSHRSTIALVSRKKYEKNRRLEIKIMRKKYQNKQAYYFNMVSPKYDERWREGERGGIICHFSRNKSLLSTRYNSSNRSKDNCSRRRNEGKKTRRKTKRATTTAYNENDFNSKSIFEHMLCAK